MDSEKLLACPFCGDSKWHERGGREQAVCCLACGVIGPSTDYGPEEARRRWNTRPTPENGLREALERIAAKVETAKRIGTVFVSGVTPDDLDILLSALRHNTGERDELPDDVRALVIAAREFWDIHDSPVEPESQALDQALEAFASRVPFANEPALSQAPR